MAFGTPAYDLINCTVAGASLAGALRGIRINSGSNFGPYKGGPQPASATIVFYYRPGVTVPASIAVNATVYVTNSYVGFTYGNLFYGRIRDFSITSTLDESSNRYGKTVTIYATNVTADLNAIPVRGISTSATTKNETWEQRLTNTLQPYFGTYGGTFPSTATEAHIYRLVDNNIDGTLVDQLNIACDSVGATWQPRMINDTITFYAKGVYPKTGILFSDEANYWTVANKPANSISEFGSVLNVLYSDIDVSRDTRFLANRINVTNVMPRNIILSNATAGVLTYKDPQTARPENMQVIEPTYQVQNATSITTYGVRPQDIQTNVYPYRTTDTESFYLRFNGYNDPGIEYRSDPQVSCTNANVRFSTVTPETGTYCLDVVTTGGGASYLLILGDPAGYQMKVTPVANTNIFNLSWRTAQANARFTRGIQYLDSNGNVLLTQSGGTNTPTLNTWTTQGGVFMDYTTIPAGTVAWRPILTITHASGTFGVGTTIAKLDNITINPDLQQQAVISGDTADTTGNVYGWEFSPGQSWSYMQRNVLDNIGTDVLTYWKDNSLKPRSITWNVRLSYYSSVLLQPLARVDIRWNGSNYVSFINSYTIDITPENCIVSAELGYRPSSWN